MKPTPSEKLAGLPPYLFVRLAALRQRAEAAGRSIIDLGQGSPDLPSPPNVVSALKSAVDEPWTHRYPQTGGLPALRKAIAAWYLRRFDVRLDPDSEVLPLVGSKEGLAHLFMALLEPGPGVLVPSPCYPVHYNGRSSPAVARTSCPSARRTAFSLNSQMSPPPRPRAPRSSSSTTPTIPRERSSKTTSCSRRPSNSLGAGAASSLTTTPTRS